MNIRKTQRKNKTKQTVLWPSHDEYFTIADLVALNPNMLTSAPKPSDITLRVRLNKAITEEPYEVAVIGQKNCGKGRPKLIFAMRPVKQSAIDKAKADGISIDSNKLITVMQISTQTSTPVVTPVTNITSTQTVNV